MIKVIRFFIMFGGTIERCKGGINLHAIPNPPRANLLRLRHAAFLDETVECAWTYSDIPSRFDPIEPAGDKAKRSFASRPRAGRLDSGDLG